MANTAYLPRYWPKWMRLTGVAWLAFRLRWVMACYRDKRPDKCWARMAIWAMFREPWRDFFDTSEHAVDASCDYCGKCSPPPPDRLRVPYPAGLCQRAEFN